MPHDTSTAFILRADVTGLDKIVSDLGGGLFGIAALDQVVGKYAEAIRAQAVKNVSGETVIYSGGTFIVNRDTGKLSQSMQVVNVATLTRIVLNSANYASDVETGIKSYDMKPGLMGKTIPINVRGKVDPLTGKQIGNKIARKSATGRVTGYDYILFRRVGPNSKGWIHPGTKPRPFLQAAAEKWEPEFQAAAAEAVAKFLDGKQ